MLNINFGLFFKKIGCTTFFNKVGAPFLVTALKEEEVFFLGKEELAGGGYLLKVGFGIAKSELKVNKPTRVYLKNNSLPMVRNIRVLRAKSLENLPEIGERIEPIKFFKKDQYIDATSFSKGKGFAGVMKRHNFKGGSASHGNSLAHRTPGSTGSNQDPGRVFKGKKMPGRMGNKQVTQMNLRISHIDNELSYIFVSGAIPGYTNCSVFIKEAIKKRKILLG